MNKLVYAEDETSVSIPLNRVNVFQFNSSPQAAAVLSKRFNPLKSGQCLSIA